MSDFINGKNMITSLDCIPCLLRQVIEASRFFYAEEALQENILRNILSYLSETGFSEPPPVIAQKIHRRIKEISGIDDPYFEVKDRFNSMAVLMLGTLTERIEHSPEPLLNAVKLSIAGNIIDCGAKSGLSEFEVRNLISDSFTETVKGHVDQFLQASSEAEKIMFIADNAGEIVFDRPLIEMLGAGRVTLAVRGFPVINDATIRDARAAGLDRIVRVIENGSDAPGTILEECSDEFKKCYDQSDLIIAKGQGNYETLCDEKKQIFFLLKVKCHIIADHTGFPAGTHLVVNTGSAINRVK